MWHERMQHCYRIRGGHFRKHNSVKTTSLTWSKTGRVCICNAAHDKRATRKDSHQNKDATSTESYDAYDFIYQCCNRLCKSKSVSTAIQEDDPQPILQSVKLKDTNNFHVE